jgi:hypothetical protein
MERAGPGVRGRCRVVTATAATTAVALLAGAGLPGANAGTLKRAPDPLASAAMRSYLAARDGAVTAAVQDLRTGQTWLLNPGARDETASIIKADILETLLRRAEVTDRPLDGADPGVIDGMIENSDNDDASILWRLAGASGGVGAYDAAAGLSQTALNTQGYWGESTTSALDQIRLLRQLALPGGLLGPGAQRYALGLMTHVEADQAWGVSGGVPAGVSVAVKNGWLPIGGDAGDWEINSIGRVKGDGRWYLVAVLTAQDPSLGYGVDTIAHMSGLIWSGLRPVIAPTLGGVLSLPHRKR